METKNPFFAQSVKRFPVEWAVHCFVNPFDYPVWPIWDLWIIQESGMHSLIATEECLLSKSHAVAGLHHVTDLRYRFPKFGFQEDMNQEAFLYHGPITNFLHIFGGTTWVRNWFGSIWSESCLRFSCPAYFRTTQWYYRRVSIIAGVHAHLMPDYAHTHTHTFSGLRTLAYYVWVPPKLSDHYISALTHGESFQPSCQAMENIFFPFELQFMCVCMCVCALHHECTMEKN